MQLPAQGRELRRLTIAFADVALARFSFLLGNPLKFPPLGPAKTLGHHGDARNVRNV